MMVLGREEPLCRNKHLNALDETYNEVKQSRVEDDGLNRYCFVWLGAFEERDPRLVDLVRHIRNEFSEDACWYLAWPAFTKEAAALSQERIELREGEGWAVHSHETFHVAQRGTDFEALTALTPEGYEKKVGDAGTFLIFGDAPPAPEFSRPPLKKTIEMQVRTREFAPSSPFLSFIRERGLTLAYTMRDFHSQLGLVVVTPRKLNTDRLQEAGFADTIHKNEEAPLAWRYSEQ